ncbi:transcriptional regulator [Streptomyces sp. ISL-96]|uniref:ScbA/BarX family gamma-butyrolactone biosynthesis protein n=1 Tax=Streptomyces sp. ISL-96 TaxID=2819191 RepID=UPI001BE79B4E|nr:ScbA/BarX family gamma-butyrolactone biosynthesis protein [Streptomyces sp. ISL-96]MBT2493434.1 transcriptional regulator [Streptomyces sp. ISL-96]
MLISTDRPAGTKLDLTRTVAKEYVHRAALSEVFLTGWTKVGADTFTVSAQWPRSHSFYGSEHGMHDPLLLCETVRQTFPLLAHVAYDVPFGHQLSWSHFQYAVNPDALRTESTPAEIELHVTCSDIKYVRSLPTMMSMHIEAVRNGSLLATVSTRFGCHSPAVYQRLRAGRANVAETFPSVPRPPAPVPPSVVGRYRQEDIVLTPTQERGRWQLRIDTAHPVLFDHPVDHVPGMVLLESVRQAGHALQPSSAAVMPTSMSVSFNRYVEFDSPCWIIAEEIADTSTASGARQAIRVSATQGEGCAFTATAELTDPTSL